MGTLKQDIFLVTAEGEEDNLILELKTQAAAETKAQELIDSGHITSVTISKVVKRGTSKVVWED